MWKSNGFAMKIVYKWLFLHQKLRKFPSVHQPCGGFLKIWDMPKSSILNHVNRIFHDKPSNLRGSPFMEKKTCEGFYIFSESTVQKAHWIDIVLRSRKRHSKNRFPTFFCPQQILGRVETLILRASFPTLVFCPST